MQMKGGAIIWKCGGLLRLLINPHAWSKLILLTKGLFYLKCFQSFFYHVIFIYVDIILVITLLLHCRLYCNWIHNSLAIKDNYLLFKYTWYTPSMHLTSPIMHSFFRWRLVNFGFRCILFEIALQEDGFCSNSRIKSYLAIRFFVRLSEPIIPYNSHFLV